MRDQKSERELPDDIRLLPVTDDESEELRELLIRAENLIDQGA